MQVERDISAPPETVWRIISDLDRSVEVITAIKAVDRLDEGEGFGVGTRWDETRSMFGRDATETLEITALDEGHSYTVEAEGNGVRYRSVMSVDATGAGSRISMSFAGEATSFAARIGAFFGKLFEGTTRKMLQRDLDDIAAAAEAAESGAIAE